MYGEASRLSCVERRRSKRWSKAWHDRRGDIHYEGEPRGFMKDKQPWLDGNKPSLSTIIDAIPDHKLYLVKDVKYAC
jgi:hypothetical protein